MDCDLDVTEDAVGEQLNEEVAVLVNQADEEK